MFNLWDISVGLNDLLDSLLADGALLVDDLGALFAEAAMAARHHHGVDFASHAHSALVVARGLRVLVHLLRIHSHHLAAGMVHLLVVLVLMDWWQKT